MTTNFKIRSDRLIILTYSTSSSATATATKGVRSTTTTIPAIITLLWTYRRCISCSAT